MTAESIDDIEAFLAVVREGSFTRAAAMLGVSQSALSQTVRKLEAQVGLRLLTRTTRSVAPTEAGDRLLQVATTRITEIREELAAIQGMRDKPAGSFRLSATEHAALSVLWPALHKFLPAYPDINVEIIVDYGLTDIVAERFDAGVRLGDTIDKDMIAVRISPDQQLIVVGSPSYLSDRPRPETPRDLLNHRCINLRLPTRGGLYVWEFQQNGREQNVRVEGQLVFNSLALMTEAAFAGAGLAYLPADIVRPHIDAGRLVSVLSDWSPTYAGYHLYYPSRRQPSASFTLLVEALRSGNADAINPPPRPGPLSSSVWP